MAQPSFVFVALISVAFSISMNEVENTNYYPSANGNEAADNSVAKNNFHAIEKRSPSEPGLLTFSDYLKMGHGILMTVTWGIFIVTGVMFARHFRGHEAEYCGVKMWFSMHRALNTVGLVLMTISLIMIIVAEGGWSGPWPPFKVWHSGTTHSLLGALAVITAYIQPLNAVFRCKPKSRRRGMFTWGHRILGATSFILAMSAMVVACFYFKPMYGDHLAAMVIWIVYLAILVLSMLAKLFIYWREWSTHKDSPPDKIIFESECAKKWRAIILVSFLISASVLSIALCVLIALKQPKPIIP